jgi:chemotaxis protein histidine kinase CheA
MTASTNALNYFALEAGECLEQMDLALPRLAPQGGGGEDFVANARRLRGSAVMYRVTGMAELAGAVERAGRGITGATIRWSPALSGALVAAVDDLKLLLHAVRTWGPDEQARVARRIAELDRHAMAAEATVPIADLAPDDGEPQIVRRRPTPPKGPALRAALETGITQLSELADRPLTELSPEADSRQEVITPTVRVTQDANGVVAIETLLYRGPAALSRARTLGQMLRATAAGNPPGQDVLDELYDLLDLAATPA